MFVYYNIRYIVIPHIHDVPTKYNETPCFELPFEKLLSEKQLRPTCQTSYPLERPNSFTFFMT